MTGQQTFMSPDYPLRLVGIQRLPDGAYRIELAFHVKDGPFEMGVLQFDSPRLLVGSPTREWPCEFLSPAEWKGGFPAEVLLLLRVSPSADMRKGHLMIDYEYDAKSAFRKSSSSGTKGVEINLPAPLEELAAPPGSE
jgi:hypothetical protein